MKWPAKAKLRWALDISILLLALFVSYSLWKGTNKHSFPSQGIPEIRPGALLSIPGGLDTSANLAVVLALSSQCPACEQGTSFFSELALACRKGGISVVALFEQPEHQAKGWLSQRAIQIDRVKSTPLRQIGFRIVPSLALIGGDGRVSTFLEGSLSFREEARVIESVEAGRDLGGYLTGASDLPSMISESRLESLIEERAGRLQLLQARAMIELEPEQLTVVDCLRVPYAICSRAARALAVLGFEQVTIADRGGAPCPTCRP